MNILKGGGVVQVKWQMDWTTATNLPQVWTGPVAKNLQKNNRDKKIKTQTLNIYFNNFYF